MLLGEAIRSAEHRERNPALRGLTFKPALFDVQCFGRLVDREHQPQGFPPQKSDAFPNPFGVGVLGGNATAGTGAECKAVCVRRLAKICDGVVSSYGPIRLRASQ